MEDNIDMIKGVFDKLMKKRPHCDNLKKILLNILAYGNYMNGTTKRGGCWGFELSSLVKVS